jgi:hypothetical protein
MRRFQRGTCPQGQGRGILSLEKFRASSAFPLRIFPMAPAGAVKHEEDGT